MSRTDGPETTRVTDKGQTIIPKPLREKYGIEPGDEVVWIEDDDGIRIVRADRTEGRGTLLPEADEETRRAVVEDLAEQNREDRESATWNTGR